MYHYTDWTCRNCERSFCLAVDDEDFKGEDTPACPRCGSKSVTPDEALGPFGQEDAQQDSANRPGVLDLVAAVRILNSPWDTSEVPEGCGLSSTWFSPEDLCKLAQLKLERQSSLSGCGNFEWSELRVRRLLFLKGIRCWSYTDAGNELGASREVVFRKYEDLCKVFGLVEE